MDTLFMLEVLDKGSWVITMLFLVSFAALICLSVAAVILRFVEGDDGAITQFVRGTHLVMRFIVVDSFMACIALLAATATAEQIIYGSFQHPIVNEAIKGITQAASMLEQLRDKFFGQFAF